MDLRAQKLEMLNGLKTNLLYDLGTKMQEHTNKIGQYYKAGKHHQHRSGEEQHITLETDEMVLRTRIFETG